MILTRSEPERSGEVRIEGKSSWPEPPSPSHWGQGSRTWTAPHASDAHWERWPKDPWPRVQLEVIENLNVKTGIFKGWVFFQLSDFLARFWPDLVITDKLPCFSVLCQMIEWTNGKTEKWSRDLLLTSMLMRNKNSLSQAAFIDPFIGFIDI